MSNPVDPRTLRELLEQNETLKRELAGVDVSNDATNKAGLFVGAVVTLSIVGVAAIALVVTTRPPEEHVKLIATVLGFLVPSISAFLGGAVQQVHLAVNSRLSQLLRLTRMASRAEGVLIAEKADVTKRAGL